MGKYSGVPVNLSEWQFLMYICNELAEMNRLKRFELAIKHSNILCNSDDLKDQA